MNDASKEQSARQGVLPLTPAQAGMYFQYLADPGSRTYAQQIVLRLRGKADLNALCLAWYITAGRHEALRAVFKKTPAGAVQTILAKPPHVVTLADFSLLSASCRQRELTALMREEREHKLDIEHGPTLRACLARLSPDEHILCLSFHHILMDGWCTAILLNEMLCSHNALIQDQDPSLEPAPKLAPALEWLAARNTNADISFWRGYLEGFTESSPLAGRFSVPNRPGAGYSPREHFLSLGHETTSRLNAFAAKASVTPSALLQAAWALLLARQTDSRDVAFGLVTSGREAEVEGMERLVGVFIHTLPVRLSLSDPNESLADLARRIQAEAARRLPHEALPLPDIQAQTPLGQNLFDHLLLFENFPTGLGSSNLHVAEVTGFEQLPYDFGLAVLPGKDLSFRFSFNERVYSKAFVEALARRWLTLIRCALDSPEAAAQALCVLPSEQYRHLTRFCETTRRNWPDPRPVPFLFADRAASLPEKTALIVPAPGSDKYYSYAELAGRVGQLAELLSREGANRETPVAVCLERGADLPASLLAVQTVGAPYVPLDPLYPPERLAYILADCGAKLVLAQRTTASVLKQSKASGPRIILLDDISWIPAPIPLSASRERPSNVGLGKSGSKSPLPPLKKRGGDLSLREAACTSHTLNEEGDSPPFSKGGSGGIFNQPSADEPPFPVAEDLAYIIYTSGSTGAPKGVEVTHRGLTNFLLSMAEAPGLTSSDTLLAVTTVCFDIAGLELFLPLIQGARIVLASREDAADAGRLMELMDQYDVSILQATPTTWSMLVSSGWRGRETLKALVGGEALPPRLARAMLSRSAEVWNLYGPTETTIWSTLTRLRPALDGLPVITIGTPLANTTAYILGSDLSLLPEGAAGELCLGGHGLARGYRNRPDLTAERFVTLPFPPHERVYRTGDLAAWTESGNLTYFGRTDFQVKVRGFRIEPGEIETKLTSISGISQAVVMAADYRGAGTELAAWIVGANDLSDSELRRLLLGDLPYYMVPALFIRMESLPLTPNGKIDRKALPVPQDLKTRPESATKHPSIGANKAQSLLAGIWQNILRVEDIGPEDNFFDLGGHSLLAMRLAAAIEEATGRSLPIRTIFEHPTLAAQAGIVGNDAGPHRQPIPPAPKAASYPLTPAQHRLWALQQMSPDVAAYAVPGLLVLEGETSPERLRRAVTEALNRHESLRTGFITEGDEPRQIVLEDPPDFFEPDIDLSHEADPKSAAVRLAQDMAGRPFDLKTPPLRARLARLAPQSYALCIVLHHIVCDEWSLDILSRDIAAWHGYLRESGQKPDPGAKIGYKDYAFWLHERLALQDLTASRNWWLNQLAPPLDPLDLCPDKQRPPLKTFAGASLNFALSPELYKDLKAIAASSRTTEFTVLAALIFILLFRESEQQEIRLGVPLAGREHPELSGVVGMFVNSLVVRQHLRPERSFAKTLLDVAKTLRQAIDRAEYPFEALIEELRLPHDPSRTPLFDVMLVLKDKTLPQEMDGLHLSSLSLARKSAKFDLSFLFEPSSDGGLLAEIEYAKDLFTERRIGSFARQFLALARAACTDPQTAVADLNRIDPAEDAAPLQDESQIKDQLPDSFPQTEVVSGSNLKETIESLGRLFKTESSAKAVRLTPTQAALLPSLNLTRSRVQIAILCGEPAGPAAVRILLGLNPGMEIFEELCISKVEANLIRRLTPNADSLTRRIFRFPLTCNIRILDSRGNPCPKLSPGELCLKGTGKIERTGLRARLLDEGLIELIGAIDPIRPGLDPEAAGRALEDSPLVARAVVIAKAKGDGTAFLTAFVLPSAQGVRKEELLRFLRKRLPVPNIPERINFLESPPLTADGRVDRKALAELIDAAPFAQPSQSVEASPPDETEARLCKLFAQALGIDKAEPDTHFFAWGGDSLKALRLCQAIEAAFGLPCRAGELFSAPTPCELALRLEETRALKSSDAGDSDAGNAEEPGFDDLLLSEEERRLLLELAGR